MKASYTGWHYVTPHTSQLDFYIEQMVIDTKNPIEKDRKLVARQQPTSDSSFVSASYANLVFHSLGDTPVVEEIFTRHGITRELLEDSAGLIKFDSLAQAVFELIEIQNIPDAGLSLGSNFHISTHGSVGMAIISAETVGEAIKDAARYYQTSITFCNLEVYYRDDKIILEVKETTSFPEIRVVVIEAIMLTLQNALEFVSGKKLTDSCITFAFPAPEYAGQYANYFSGKIEFNGKSHMMVLPAELANVRCITADSQIHRLAEEQLKQKMQEIRSNNLTMQHVLAELRRKPEAMPTLETMATNFSVSSRTLIRYLQAEGTTYRDLRNMIHKQMATDSLRNTDNSIDAIAMELGYQDTASFRRAFKRWYGVSPSEYRERIKR